MQLELVLLETPWFKEGLLFCLPFIQVCIAGPGTQQVPNICSPCLRFAMSRSHIHIHSLIPFFRSFICLTAIFLSAECCLGLSLSPWSNWLPCSKCQMLPNQGAKTGCKEILKLKKERLICHRYWLSQCDQLGRNRRTLQAAKSPCRRKLRFLYEKWWRKQV